MQSLRVPRLIHRTDEVCPTSAACKAARSYYVRQWRFLPSDAMTGGAWPIAPVYATSRNALCRSPNCYWCNYHAQIPEYVSCAQFQVEGYYNTFVRFTFRRLETSGCGGPGVPCLSCTLEDPGSSPTQHKIYPIFFSSLLATLLTGRSFPEKCDVILSIHWPVCYPLSSRPFCVLWAPDFQLTLSH